MNMSKNPQSYSIRLGKRELVYIRSWIDKDMGSKDFAKVHLLFGKSLTSDWQIFTARGVHPTKTALDLVLGEVTVLCLSDTQNFANIAGTWLRHQPNPFQGDPLIKLLIGSGSNDCFELAGLVWTGKQWHPIDHAFLEQAAGSSVWERGLPPAVTAPPPERVARFTSSFGIEAYQRLRRSTAVVIGAGGTGSVAIPMLARAGVGRIVIVDSDHITPSNLERTHASFPCHVKEGVLKAELARDHVRQIDPDIDVVAIEGRLPQREIVEQVMLADVLVGCTDQHTSRMAISDIARRYLVPAIDCGGLIEGANGRVTGQIIQLVTFRPDDPCPICRGMVDPIRVRQELMSNSEREAIRAANQEGELPPEAHEIPQIDTVGYITTISGSLAAGYTIGWMTGRFEPPFERMQMNLIADCLDVTDRPQKHANNCDCHASRGLGDIAIDKAPFAPPSHWKPARHL